VHRPIGGMSTLANKGIILDPHTKNITRNEQNGC
jgi:hypothetical protein